MQGFSPNRPYLPLGISQLGRGVLTVWRVGWLWGGVVWVGVLRDCQGRFKVLRQGSLLFINFIIREDPEELREGEIGVICLGLGQRRGVYKLEGFAKEGMG